MALNRLGGLSFALLLALAFAAQAARGGTLRIAVDDPDGLAGRTQAPLMLIRAAQELPDGRLVDSATGKEIPCQLSRTSFKWDYLDPARSGRAELSKRALWWRMPAGAKGKQTLELKPSEPAPEKSPFRVAIAEDRSHAEIREGDKLVLRYYVKNAPLPEGVPARYACGDYIHPLCGPDGEALTEAHPKDHPHHRGVMWTWPVAKWNGQARDPWVCAGCWSRPEAIMEPAVGPLFAEIGAQMVWMWDDKTPVLRETVTIRAFREVERARLVEIEVSLNPLVDGLTICGRPYGGFGLRLAPRKAQQITLLTDPVAAKPRRSWIEYSDTFAGGTGRVGVALFEEVTNPQYPNVLLKYPELNYVMPGFPGSKEFELRKSEIVILRHRLWIHPGHADETALSDQWAACNAPPKVTAAAGE